MNSRRTMAVLGLLSFLLLSPVTGETEAATAPAAPIVAAAADLKFALEEIASRFEKETGHSVRLVFGSSGTFATQIRNGAPFDIYLAADEEYILKLHADGFTRDKGVLYGTGRLALLAPANSSLPVDPELRGVAARLKSGGIRRFAIANPEHAPYGKRAEEALRRAKLWDGVKPKLVLGENVAQAAQFAVSGSADGGIIALSLARSPEMRKNARIAVIPASWHAPLRQRMVLLKNADPVAHSFYRYLQGEASRKVLASFGFEPPGEGK